MSFFSESDLPGIGKKIICDTHSNEKLALIIHHDGTRELYIMDNQGEPISGITLMDEEARRLGIFLSGEMFKPKAIENLETALEGLNIEWYKLHETYSLVGKKIDDADITLKTGVSLIGILKENETFILNPDSSYIFDANDTCVVVGDPAHFKTFSEFIR